MSDHSARRRSFESLKKDAKRWLAAIRRGDPDALARYRQAVPHGSLQPTLRDVQLAIARLHGFDGWTALKRALGPEATAAGTLAQYETMADALLDAYQTGAPEAMARHHRFTWHRRSWSAMRTYVQLDLGKRPTTPGDDVSITIDDARHLVAVEHGFAGWNALRAFVSAVPGGVTLTIKPMRVRSGEPGRSARAEREWPVILARLQATPDAALEAGGGMTDALLGELATIETVTSLDLSGSHALTDEGLQALARMPQLRRLRLDNTAITDRGVEVLRSLPNLERVSLAMTGLTDAGAIHLAACPDLERVNLMWTATGDVTVDALAGKPRLRHFQSGEGVTDAGIAKFRDWPVFATWRGGEARLALFGADPSPNRLTLRGSFTDDGLRHLRGLDGLFGLNLDDSRLAITAAGLAPLLDLPHLGWLSVDAKDDWMPLIAALPHLQFLGAQDTTAGDDGFAALGRSKSIEYIWGRRCHNLRDRGFRALAGIPTLRGLAVSCLKVSDAALSALPAFPALRELMPMDVPDAGYRHVGRCDRLESLILMYCRDTTDAATAHVARLPGLTYYFNSYTTITDRTPALLASMDTLERVTLDACHELTNAGVAALARLPRLRELRVSGRGVTSDLRTQFPPRVDVAVGG